MLAALKQVFPLNKIARALRGYRLPGQNFDAEGAYENRYSTYSLISRDARIGDLRIQRKTAPGAAPQLNIDFHKKVPSGLDHRCTAAIRCGEGPLGQPDFWQFEYHVEKSDGTLAEFPRFRRTFRASEGRIVSSDGELPAAQVEGPHTLNWSLFDAVQRLPRDRRQSYRFTLVDHYDRVLPNQMLSYRGAFEVLIGETRVKQKKNLLLEKGEIIKTVWGMAGGVPEKLHAFDHVGPGTLPWVYWVNETGRLLFAVSGLEAYILDTGPEER